jgi:hypothetical protein
VRDSTLPYSRFEDFVRLNNNRFDILCSLLDDVALPYNIVKIAGSRHIIASCGRPPGKGALVLVAHYDRVADSEGANDNAAAVFMLLDAALRLRNDAQSGQGGGKAVPFFFIWTDNEELKKGQRLTAQGSYALAKACVKTDLHDALFFIFDACGRGDTLIISTTADYLLKNESGEAVAETRMKLKLLRNTALEAAEKTQNEAFMLLPTPFSDDAGFLRAGITAQTITVLPKDEAQQFAALSRYNPLYINALVSEDMQNSQEKFTMPQTWQLLNGPRDTRDKLTLDHFESVVRFIIALCRGG